MDVMKYLKRPRFIERIALTSVNNFQTFYPITRQFLDTHFDLSTRFKGANGVRFNICFRVVAAATPQTQGVLRMYYDPVPSVSGVVTYSDTYRNSLYSNHFSAYTQLPGVELDFRDATAMEFKVPYTQILEFMPLLVEGTQNLDDSFSMGAVVITDYLVVRYPGTRTPYITTYCWLEDVEVFGAINNPISAIAPQSGGVEDITVGGPMSGPLYKLSSAASLVAGAIPVLSSMMSPLAWALRMSSNAIAAFGYSRPLQLEAVPRAFLTTQHYQNNADGPDASFNMGLLQGNSVEVVDNLSYTNQDEMSIAFLTMKKCCIAKVRVNDATLGRFCTLFLAPTAMYALQANTPSSVPFERLPHLWTNPGSGVQVKPSPLMWLSTMFNKYRGGFKVTIKCNSTMFHAGRILLTYTPYARGRLHNFYSYTSGTPGNVDTDLTGFNKVWDLREGNSCFMDCPYFSLTPYMRDDQPIGTFSLSVMDGICLTGTVTATIDFAIEVEGLPGFEFAEPHQGPYIVDPGLDWRSNEAGYATSQVVPQSGTLVNFSKPSEKCIGEKILSLKQLLSRAEWTTFQTYRAFKKDFAHSIGAHLPHWFDPRVCTGTIDSGGGILKLSGTYQMSTHNSIIYAYLFARGGTCFDIVGDTLGLVNYGVINEGVVTGQAQVSSQMWEDSGNMKVKAPFYSNTQKVYVAPAKADVNVFGGTQLRVGTGYQSQNRPLMYYGTNVKTRIGKRAADDAQLGFFLFAPPLRYVGVTGAFETSAYSSPGAIDAKVYFHGLT